MKMTIEQDIKVIRKMLACTDLRARENLHADMIDACEDAIATMRKYQKIEKIINNTFQNIAKEDERYAYEWLGDIKEVMEDGKIDG